VGGTYFIEKLQKNKSWGQNGEGRQKSKKYKLIYINIALTAHFIYFHHHVTSIIKEIRAL
jgi:hypothetical protein